MRAGDKVTIAEKKDRPGGRVATESTLPGLQSWSRVRDYRLHQLNASANVDLFLESEMNADLAEQFDADTVTVATGAAWRADGVGSTNFDTIDFGDTQVLTPDDIMNSSLSNLPLASVVVYDDDHFYIGSVIAEALSTITANVSYVTPLPAIATWTDNTLDQPAIINRLQQLGVKLLPNTSLTEDGTFINTLTEQHITLSVNTTVVMVGARSSNNALFRELHSRGNIRHLYETGDCVVPGIIQAAVYSGHATAKTILDNSQQLKRREQITLVS